jgi:hypothetical protein
MYGINIVSNWSSVRNTRMLHNPALASVVPGDIFTSGIKTFGNDRWVYKSTVLEIGELTKRFGEPDRILTVRIHAHELNASEESRVVVAQKKIWWSDCNNGLI